MVRYRNFRVREPSTNSLPRVRVAQGRSTSTPPKDSLRRWRCLLSGVLYQVAGLSGCLWGAFAFALIAALISLWLPHRALHPELLAHAGVKASDRN